MKQWLKGYETVPICYTSHAMNDKIRRGFAQQADIEENIRKPVKLIACKQEDINLEHPKYKLTFTLSRARTLVIIVRLNQEITVITAWEIINKWQRRLWKR